MVPAYAMVVALTRIWHAAIGASGIDRRLSSFHQSAVASTREQQRQHKYGPHCATQTNETRALVPPDDSSIAFATRGPAASQAPWLANEADPIALTSPGWMKNQSTSVHMGAS